MSLDFKVLNDIHARVREGFRYVSDETQHSVIDHWGFPEDVDRVTGDCDDFAVACRMLVKEQTEFPCRLVICTTETGECHLVCAAGQYILDNRQSTVRTKEGLEGRGYTFLYYSGLNPGDDWVKIDGPT